MTNKYLYRISVALAVIPTTVGVLILLIWWAARAFFAENIYDIETVGFYCTIVSVILLALSLILITVYIFKKQNPEKAKLFFTILVLIGLNVLILDIVIKKVEEIQQYAFVKITNETQVILKINFYTYLKAEKELQLKQGKNKVISYIPEYKMKSERDYDIVPLIFEAGGKTFEAQNIERNECKQYVLDEHFTLLERK